MENYAVLVSRQSKKRENKMKTRHEVLAGAIKKNGIETNVSDVILQCGGHSKSEHHKLKLRSISHGQCNIYPTVVLLYWGREAPGESWTLSWGSWIIHGNHRDWHEPRKGTRTAGMAGRQIGYSDGILIVLQGTQPISVIVMLKMQHNTNPFSRVLKQTMITEKQSLNTRQDRSPRPRSGSMQQSGTEPLDSR